jgi:hypothetical protein
MKPQCIIQKVLSNLKHAEIALYVRITMYVAKTSPITKIM